jgi:pyruvate formate lyase activating enzyme
MEQGKLFDIQFFGVHDGPGIRTLVFLKGCPLQCAWCCNPESQSPEDQIRYVDFRCKACFNCVSACPHQAIAPLIDSIRIDFARCSACLERPCLDACYNGALNLTGYTIGTGDLIKIIAKDSAFYRNSGGGVTFTGGEPLSQPEFLAEIIQESKTAGIHTAVETCGYCSQADLERIIPLVDLFLFDIKIVDPKKHMEFTGKSNRVILDNLRYLAKQGKRIIIRFPLIPGITDTQENISDIIELMNRLQLTEINLEPYHSLGVPKYTELGMNYSLSDITDDSGYPVDRYKQIEELFVSFL